MLLIQSAKTLTPRRVEQYYLVVFCRSDVAESIDNVKSHPDQQTLVFDRADPHLVAGLGLR